MRLNRSIVASALALSLGLLSTPLAQAADTFKVDPVHSYVVFQIKHLDVGNNWGRANSPTGTFTIDDADASKSSISISVKADSIDTGNAARDTHLKGPDFFDAKQFPNITFKSTAVKKTGEKTYEVTGDFTLHGVTKPLTVTLTKVGEGDKGAQAGGVRAGYETSFTIKRTDFGMTGMTQAVGDEVKLTVSFEGTK